MNDPSSLSLFFFFNLKIVRLRCTKLGLHKKGVRFTTSFSGIAHFLKSLLHLIEEF